MKGYRVSTTINANIQNEINKSIIFHYLCANDRVYRGKIARELGISAPAVGRVIERLIAEGFVVENGKIPTGKGKMASELSVNTRKGTIIGIDLIKERTKIAISDFRGRIMGEYSGFRFSDTTNVELSLIAEIDRILGLHGVGRSRKSAAGKLLGICVGIPAATWGTGRQRISTPLYRSLEGLDLRETLGRRYRVPIYVENIVKLSALAEMNFGVARNLSDFVFVEISNGIGAGIIFDGHVYRGATGASGELGFTLLGTDSLRYRATEKGLLEKLASTEGIAQKAVEAARRDNRTLMLKLAGGELEKITALVACEAALQNDEAARQIIEETVESLSVGIINLILILDPQIIVLGGDICRLPGLQELIIEPIRKNAERLVPFTLPPIATSTLGEDAGLLGACHHAIESLLTSRFPFRLGSAPSEQNAQGAFTPQRPTRQSG
jgi:predicted NBD/HSP70 family sugar kinase